MGDRDRRGSASRVYCGNLPPDVRERDIEDVFRKYGKVVHCDLRTNKGPPFAFVDFEDKRDAEDAVYGRDGYDLDGYKIRVEFPRSLRDGRDGRNGGRFSGERDRNGGGGGGGYGGRGGGGGFSSRGGGGGFSRGGGGANLRRSKYRVDVTGLPPSGSWQDLKDHLREAGDVCYADVTKDGSGVAEFMRYEDMKYAVKKLDDTKFRSHEGETAYIRIKAAPGASRSHSASPGARGSRSRSPISRPSARVGSPNGAGGGGGDKDLDKARDSGTERKRSASRSRSRSHDSRSKTHSRSKTPVSRSPSRERERGD